MTCSTCGLAGLILCAALVLNPGRSLAADEPSQAWLKEDIDKTTVDEGPLPGVGTKILFYPVNRILDLLDIIHFDIGFGLGLHANVHATRMIQLGAGGSALSRLGLDGRHAGLFNEKRFELSVLPFSTEKYRIDGTLGNINDFDTATEREQLYEDVRDYFEVGAAVTAGIVGVQADIRPSGILDFLVGWAGFDPQNDDHPINFARDKYPKFDEKERASISKMIVVTSRVTQSPHVGSEAASGVAVFHHRANGEFFWGELGRLSSAGADAAEEAQLNEGLNTLGYDVEADLAQHFEEAYRKNASRTEIIPATTFAPFAAQRVSKHVADETVRRLPNYAGLCKAYSADAVCDLRVLEWSVFQHQPTSGLRIRLNVECKIIKQPENEILVDIGEKVYDVEKVTKTGMSDFLENNSRLVRIETQQAMERLIPEIIDKLFEKSGKPK